MNDTKIYCGKGLDDFHTAYYAIHGYVSLVVCIFGSIANTLNIAVLTRRDMRSPTNSILTGLAVADLLVMIDYIPYTLNEYIIQSSREDQRSYTWARLVLFHSIFSQVCHTISIFLTVMLAVWRFIAISYPQHNRLWCNKRTTYWAIFTSYVIGALIAIPSYFLFRITPEVELLDSAGNKFAVNATTEAGRNVTIYKLKESQLAMDNPILWQANFWIYSVIIKIIPCIALTILSLRLVGALLEAKQRRQKLLDGNKMMGMKGTGESGAGDTGDVPVKKSARLSDKERQTDRTTRMLLAVLVLFFITEFPQGILGLLSLSIKPIFFQCYVKLGEVSDILALINSAINFILYCSMSRQFRVTFKLLFWPQFLNRWMPVPQDDGNGAIHEMNGHTTTVTQV